MAYETAERNVFEAIVAALKRASLNVIGAVEPRLPVIPIRDDLGAVTGGLGGVTLFRWLLFEMLLVPVSMRGRGGGSVLMAATEAEARNSCCLGIHGDAPRFQFSAFRRQSGFSLVGVLEDRPPGHQRLFLRKRLT